MGFILRNSIGLVAFGWAQYFAAFPSFHAIALLTLFALYSLFAFIAPLWGLAGSFALLVTVHVGIYDGLAQTATMTDVAAVIWVSFIVFFFSVTE